MNLKKPSNVNDTFDFENIKDLHKSGGLKTISFKQAGNNMELEIENPNSLYNSTISSNSGNKKTTSINISAKIKSYEGEKFKVI